MESFARIARQAVACNYCFAHLGLAYSRIDIAQPRWIGPEYRTTKTKVIVVMLNPGAANARDLSVHDHRRKLLVKFRDGQVGLQDVFNEQRDDFPLWGRGRFKQYIETSLGLSLSNIGLMNIAWCASQDDNYPKTMLSACFGRHTGPALKVLSPDAIVLCGSPAHKFREPILSLLPHVHLFNVPHYAHREGREIEQCKTAEVRRFIQQQ